MPEKGPLPVCPLSAESFVNRSHSPFFTPVCSGKCSSCTLDSRRRRGKAVNSSRHSGMLSAAACPCRSATTPCSTRMLPPLYGPGHSAMSPAAKIPGALVSRKAPTATLGSTVNPPALARARRAARRCQRRPDRLERAAAIQPDMPAFDGGGAAARTALVFRILPNANFGNGID